MALELHVLSNPKQSVQELAKLWIRIVPEVDCFHLRYKHLPVGELYQAARHLLSVGIPAEALIVNSSVQIAETLGLRGVHLPERLAFPHPRPRGIRVGRSVHSLKGAERAVEEGADYLMLGHIFPSASKPGLPPLGMARLQDWTRRLELPVIAIGGINVHNVNLIKRAGCHGIAVISAVSDHERPEQVLQEMKRRWNDAD